ncbi:MgtC/SapB family protein [Flexivirga caeni]|uniref:MgtC/SapB family protein n=1 Tax=Flexivirga caeni TaxID=2294115 RepID=A0A3M9LVE5_9MICO|nr:MgtC/SapB family protein [Flexivirga caeni]RNI17280.1 MgtC/SapB family protein [Flexivirga caeni]
MMFDAHDGQGWLQVEELLLAFVLSAVIGLERQVRGKAAGTRTQTIVGTSAALILLVSKYGFNDVLGSHVILDPSRVAAQVVSGIGFLGAGLIITRPTSVRGLTTAASVWETAAIGLAAGAGLPLLAVLVTLLHFAVVLGFTPLSRWLGDRGLGERRYLVTYADGRGILREVLSTCTGRQWVIGSLSVERSRKPIDTESDGDESAVVAVGLTLTGRALDQVVPVLGAIDGVIRIDREESDDD